MATVNTTHRQYDKFKPIWQKCDDAADGQDAIHNAGEKYLPRLTDQTSAEYSAYKSRACFFNATGRTIQGLEGMLFRKPPVITAPDALVTLFNDVTLSGQTLTDFAKNTAHEILEVGRIGVLVDYPQTNTQGMTQAEVLSLNLRPYLKTYDAESIINWKTGLINNQYVLTMVVLVECGQVEKNEFQVEEKTIYRVLDLFNGAYRQRVFEINEKNEDVLISEVFPLMNNALIKEIPFYFINATNTDAEVEEPPLLDLVNVNLAHYRVTADYEHGCHFTGLPTPVITGYQAGDDKLYIGSTAAWTFPDTDAKAFFLEFTGQGLATLEKNLDRKEQQMAVLGARMLQGDKRAVEAAETAAIHRAGENSALSALANTISSGLTKVLQFFARWAGFDDTDVSIQINRDFNAAPMTAQDLVALVGAWQQGAISQDTLIYNLNAGELYPDNQNFDVEKANAKPQIKNQTTV